MKYFVLEPDVAGGLGMNTILDRSVHPPIVCKLHYEFYGWFGDAIVTSYPSFLITEGAKQQLEDIGITGANFDEAEITKSDEFNELFPNTYLPKFLWLKLDGHIGKDDFATAPEGKLIVSERALDVLQRLGIPNAIVTPLL
jgi:hypothetical protein